MNTPFEMANKNGKIVYIRPVTARDIPAEMAAQIGQARDAHAILGENGAVLGFAPNRQLAFLMARDHELAPVSVH